MSEIKLNLIDSQTILSGTIHGSVGDRCVAALSAEPETIAELGAALERFEKRAPRFKSSGNFRSRTSIDPEPFDAGILIIDLAARMIAYNSTYSRPSLEGLVEYHDGIQCTDVPLRYRLPEDWQIVDSVEEYECLHEQRQKSRATPLDARAVLYGFPLLEFINQNICLNINTVSSQTLPPAEPSQGEPNCADSEEFGGPFVETVREIHRRWLLTPRDDLEGQAPRDLLLRKQELINFDLGERCLQWSIQMEAPPGLDRNCFTYRFGGFGTHEWVIYYYLVRHLLWTAVDFRTAALTEGSQVEGNLVPALVEVQTRWLNEPCEEFGGRVPFNLIDNERRRMPEAMAGRSMVIDENCPVCKMMGDESEAGLGIYFWHLDGCNMDDEFAFSTFQTMQEWETDQREMEERHRELDRRWKEREERLARGEVLEPDSWIDPPELDECVPSQIAEPDPPAS